MRIFFTSSRADALKYQPYVDEILRLLQKHKADVTVKDKDHYAFTVQGIAEADIMIVEASSGDFCVGHEVTLALFYGKPTLVLSQKKDYSNYITHDLLAMKQYQTKHELKDLVNDFINKAKIHLSPLRITSSAMGQAVDAIHAAALSPLRHNALRDTTEFGEWARLADKDPEKACRQITKALGALPIEPAWSLFAPIYNEDTPDYIFRGAASFAKDIFTKAGISQDDIVADVDTKNGSLARNLTEIGYSKVVAVDSSREMLAEAFRLCARMPAITIIEGNVSTLRLSKKASAVTWMDFSSNFALNPQALQEQIENLLDNINSEGRLLFDVRTFTGWRVGFLKRKVSTVSTLRFQRISIRAFDQNTVRFDRFIRTKSSDNNSWNEWRREQMTERMWSLDEIRAIVGKLKNGRLEAIYDDNFVKARPDKEPGLAYIEIKKI